jgi:hypothetical protein
MNHEDMIEITNIIKYQCDFIEDLIEEDCIFGISYDEYLNHCNNNNNLLTVICEG